MTEHPDAPAGAAPAPPADRVCENCGERNPVGTPFCSSCGAYLAWEVQPPVATAADDGPAAADPGEDAEEPPPPPEPPRERFRVAGEALAVTLPVTGEWATLALQVTNVSTLVDGYVVEPVDAPAWLALDSSQVRLLPGSEDAVPVQLRIASSTLVPAQQLPVVLRVRSQTQAPAQQDVTVRVSVPVLDVPIGFRAEPRLLRGRDRESAECALVVDNSGSNHAVALEFSGSDPEGVTRFRFEPPTLGVRPGSTAAVRLVVTAPLPDAGQEAVRSLTVTATDGRRRTDAGLTWHQSTSARTEDPPVEVTVQPSVVRVQDGAVGTTQVTLDNRGGRQWAHLLLGATDPEQLVRASWSQRLVHVPPGRSVTVDAWFEAPLPEVGSELSRTVTVTATEGRRTSTATATLVQARSASPMTTLALRLEPGLVRVQDADTAVLQLLVDNRRGRSAVRVDLDASDPERAVRFSFATTVLSVGPGEVQPVGVRMDCRRPEPGQESSRPVTFRATDGTLTVEAAGTFVQTSSRSPMELLAVRLDPSVVRLPHRRRGQLSAVVDNRSGTAAVHVSLHGDDPENSLRFTFAPPVLDVAPGHTARSRVTVLAPRAPSGQQTTRPFTVGASDGRASVSAEGSVAQSAAERRPLARLLFTLAGGVAMILGGLQVWDARSGLRGVQITDDVLAGPFDLPELDLGIAAPFASVGMVAIALGVLVVFGLTAPSGRLSRVAAFFGLVLVIGLFVALTAVGREVSPGLGAVLVVLGCVAGYVGGALGRR